MIRNLVSLGGLGGLLLLLTPTPSQADNCAVARPTTYSAPVVVKKEIVKEVVKPVVVKKEVVVEEAIIAVPVATYIVPIPLYAASYVPAPPPAPVAPAPVAAPAPPPVAVPPAPRPAPVVAPVAPAPVTPAVAPVAPAPCNLQPGMAEIMMELRKLNTRLDTLERGRMGGPPPNPFQPAPMPAPPERPSDPFAPASTPAPPAPAAPGEIRPAPGVEAPGALSTTTPPVFLEKCAACHVRGREEQGGGFVFLESTGAFSALDSRQRLSLQKKLSNRSMPPRNNAYGIPPCTDAEIAQALAYLEAPH